MSAQRSQRIAIWLIAIVLAVGTIGSFFVLIIANQNEEEKASRMAKELQVYEEAKQKNDQEWADKLSKQYYKEFSAYKARVAKFNSKDVKKLTTKDLKEGTGQKVKEGNPYYAYYIGWNPRGVIFDSSLEKDQLKAPIEGGPGLIEGWSKGVVGMKEGGVRQLTIPADQAYGSEGSGEDIPPNTPLKFIVMIVKDPGEPKTPEVSEELIKYYMQQGMQQGV